MIILIPLGGTGERFKENGYLIPKALIKVFGKPIIQWVLDSLIEHSNIENLDATICIPYNKEYERYRFEDTLNFKYSKLNFKFLCLEKKTEGAAETINTALKKLNLSHSSKPVLCLDGDNFYKIDIIKHWNNENKIIVFKDTNDSALFSYISILEDTESKQVVDIVEKNKISDYACTGAYGFKSANELFIYTSEIINNNIRYKGEFYTSVVIHKMIKMGKLFKYSLIDHTQYICLGTPVQLKHFYHNYPVHSCITNINTIHKMRICFDLDNTLVTYPEISGDYSTVKPIQKNIDFLKYLKKIGNTIIIYTARRMKTHNGNVAKTITDIGKVTFDTLSKFDICYDEIYFGKPFADVYIDDMAINCFDDLEKNTGFYIDMIKPRSFNSIEQNILQTYTKRSADLSGEIYYYRNIPREVKDMFPLLIDYDNDNRWYTMEKMEGTVVTTRYISQILTPHMLINIMNSIKRLHDTPIPDTVESNDIDIYYNYCKKMETRYTEFDYSSFKKSDKIYSKLFQKMMEYEQKKKGKISVIHGDPVMTNIIINKFEKIKFIDMRGKLGDELTIYGDHMYDWAKLYQSLIGYDKILMRKIDSITEDYESYMIKTFEKKFIEMYSHESFEDLKIITASLLFSLIPLHKDNMNNCYKFYNLISFML